MIFELSGRKVFTAALLVGAADFVLPALAAEEPPAAYSTRGRLQFQDQEIAEFVTAEWPTLDYDAAVAVAARAYAAASVAEGATTLSSERLRTVLSAAGLPESTAVCGVVSTTEDGYDDVLDHLGAMMSEAGEATHVGLGRAPRDGDPFKWLWAIVLLERRINLVDPIPRQRPLHSATPLHFSLRPGWSDPQVIAQYPNGLTRRFAPAARADGWFTVVPTGRDSGRLTVQIYANGRMGPRVAAQMPIQIGVHHSDEHRPDIGDSMSLEKIEIATAREAEVFLLEIINRDRTNLGLIPLMWSEQLATVARAHSMDMVASGFFGHDSPVHGNLQRRLRKASIVTVVARENVARDTNLAHAQGSLMASPGHRTNVIATDVDLVGIGVVADHQAGQQPHWVVTEIFARPYAAPSPETVLKWRSDLQPASCEREPALDEIAAWLAAVVPPTAEIDDLTFEELKRRLHASGLKWARLNTEVSIIRTEEDVALVTKADHRLYSTCGFAALPVDSSEGHDAVMLAVVLIEPKP